MSEVTRQDAKPASLAHSVTPLWRNLSFTLMWTSTAASGFGDRMIMLAALALLGGLAANESSTAIQAGTQFFFFLPYIFFSNPRRLAGRPHPPQVAAADLRRNARTPAAVVVRPRRRRHRHGRHPRRPALEGVRPAVRHRHLRRHLQPHPHRHRPPARRAKPAPARQRHGAGHQRCLLDDRHAHRRVHHHPRRRLVGPQRAAHRVAVLPRVRLVLRLHEAARPAPHHPRRGRPRLDLPRRRVPLRQGPQAGGEARTD